MEFDFDKMPSDVAWVWALQIAKQPVGLAAFEKAQKIIKDYPEWFYDDKPQNDKSKKAPN